MPKSEWFIHIQGETLGPLPAEAVATMIKQNRVHPAEFAWTHGFDRWMRICECTEFSAHFPAPPAVPVPAGGKETAPSVPAPEAPAAEPEKPKQVFSKSRRHSRVVVKGTLETSDYKNYTVVNLSESGLFVKSNEPLPIGTELKFSLFLTGMQRPVEMTGVVIRHGQAEGEGGFAVEFTRMNPAHRRVIGDIIQRKS
jgi:hypothetical protein